VKRTLQNQKYRRATGWVVVPVTWLHSPGNRVTASTALLNCAPGDWHNDIRMQEIMLYDPTDRLRLFAQCFSSRGADAAGQATR
jgi:hypothetical protein